jgi:hypothetical protein
MTPLCHLVEAPSFYGLENADFAAFIEATSIIGGSRCCGRVSRLWLLSEKFGFRVETKESPLSKVLVLMPQVTIVIGAQESKAEFEAHIMYAMNLLVGNYNIVEHNAYKGLRHGRHNHIFEFVGVLCQP